MSDELTPADADYYPRIKHEGKWYLIVPETKTCEGCAFVVQDGSLDDDTNCKLIAAQGGDPSAVELFNRCSCGSHRIIFVQPSKMPVYVAQAVAKKLGW